MKSSRGLVLVAILSALLTLFVRERVVGPRGAEAVSREFFKIYHSRAIQRDTAWFGVPVQQTPTDMWMVQQIITELRPEVLIETGTLKGGSSLYYASVLHALNSEAKVVTVDIEDQLDKAKDFEVFRRYVTALVGDKPALVLLDSDHHKDHVLRELRLYARFVPVGGYMIVNDTDLNGHPVLPDYGPGPMEAVEEFLAADDRFVVDRGREKFMLTMYPKGYLKRVK